MSGTILEAVTKDQLNTGLDRPDPLPGFRAQPLRLPVRREEPDRARHGLLRLGAARADRQFRSAAEDVGAQASARTEAAAVIGISINDLRKNLRDLNEHMDRECRSSAARYGDRARRLAHHRHRPAAGGRIGAGGDQHRLQPGLVGHQPGPGGGGPEDRAVPARGGNRNAQGPGRGRAA